MVTLGENTAPRWRIHFHMNGAFCHLVRTFTCIDCIGILHVYIRSQLSHIWWVRQYLIQSKQRVFKCYNNQCSLKNARLEISWNIMCWYVLYCYIPASCTNPSCATNFRHNLLMTTRRGFFFMFCFTFDPPQLIHLDMEIQHIMDQFLGNHMGVTVTTFKYAESGPDREAPEVVWNTSSYT